MRYLLWWSELNICILWVFNSHVIPEYDTYASTCSYLWVYPPELLSTRERKRWIFRIPPACQISSPSKCITSGRRRCSYCDALRTMFNQNWNRIPLIWSRHYIWFECRRVIAIDGSSPKTDKIHSLRWAGLLACYAESYWSSLRNQKLCNVSRDRIQHNTLDCIFGHLCVGLWTFESGL